MKGPPYSAARAAAPAVRAHFAACLVSSGEPGEAPLAPGPDEATIEEIIDAGFWASLRREEGRSPKISLAFLPPEAAGEPLRFGHPLPLDPAVLAKLAPAVERPGIHLGVWPGGSGLRVWGTTRSVPVSCFVLEVVDPGLLVVKRRRGQEAAKYANVAVLQGDRIQMIDEEGGNVPECVPLLVSLLGFSSLRSWTDPVNVVVQLAASMRAHGRGGSLLVVPNGSAAWQDSIVHPIPYVVSPPFTALATLAERRAREAGEALLMESLRRSVDAVAGLTAVDGATVITDRFEVLAFGAKITRRRDTEPVQRVLVAEPVLGAPSAVVDPSQLGGTRHLSAAQFIHDQRDALALVASQDGRFTAFAWSGCEDVVRAHRVETLLL